MKVLIIDHNFIERLKKSEEDIITATQLVSNGRHYISQELAEHFIGAIAGDPLSDTHTNLTNRELLVLRAIAAGKTIKEISSDLSLSPKTIATYRAKISRKMGLTSSTELTRYAMHHNLAE